MVPKLSLSHDTTDAPPHCEASPIDPTAPPTPEEPHVFDPEVFEKLLQKECKMWQHKLRLQDWTVKVTLCRLNEMPDRDCIGFIQPQLDRKDAVMLLLSPMDVPLLPHPYLNDEEMNYGLTIVHELLHLHTFPFTRKLDEHETIAEEQAINAISRAIVTAYTPKVKPVGMPGTPHVGHYL